MAFCYSVFFVLFQMLGPILKLSLLIAVPAGFHVPGKVASDSANAGYMILIHITTTWAAMFFYRPFIATDITMVGGMIDAAITDVIVVHGHDDRGERLDVLLCFPIKFYICDIASIRQLMVWSLQLNLFDSGDRIIHRDMG